MTASGPHEVLIEGLPIDLEVHLHRLLRVSFFLLQWELYVLGDLFSTVFVNFLPQISPHLRRLMLVDHRVEVAVDVLVAGLIEQFLRGSPRNWV